MWLCDYKDCQGRSFPASAFDQVSGVGWVHRVTPRHTKGGRLTGTSTTIDNLQKMKPDLQRRRGTKSPGSRYSAR